MGLISGIVLGIMLGIALMAGWRYMMNYRHSKRMDKAVNIKLLNSLTRDDLKNICGDSFPEWISFPVYEQVKWLNKQLGKLWPYIADATEAIIKESVEPLLEDYRPPGITSLTFSQLSLGAVAPKIEGIRVQNLKEGQITMDIDLRWGGDPDIVLAVGAAVVASIPIQLKDLQVFTVVRAIFQLADELPCISAVVIALLAEPKPRIDYTLKAIGGSLTAIPGISSMIDDTVNAIVTDTLQWPHRIVVPIGGIPVDTSDLELKPVGKLAVTVVRANDLKNMELIGKSDPYVMLYIRPLFKVKTKVVNNNLNPVWNENFELVAEDKETQSLIIEVLDADIGEDKLLGMVKVPLNDLEPYKTEVLELRLLPSHNMVKIKDKRDRGTVTVKVRYHEFNKEEQVAALGEEKRMLEEKRKMKEEGVVGSTKEALGGAAAVVGSGVGMMGTGVTAGANVVGTGVTTGADLVGSGVSAGADLVGTGVSTGAGLVGSGVNTGAGLLGSGVSAGAGLVGTGIGAVGTGISRAGKFMGRTMGGKKSGPNASPGNHAHESD